MAASGKRVDEWEANSRLSEGKRRAGCWWMAASRSLDAAGVAFAAMAVPPNALHPDERLGRGWLMRRNVVSAVCA